MSRTKFRQAQANRTLVSFEDIKAFYKSYFVGSATVVSTVSISPTLGRINISGLDATTLELEQGDVIELNGTGAADGDYRVFSVISATQINVTTSVAMAATAGGTADFFYQEGSRYVGTNNTNWTLINGFNVQAVLDSIDIEIQNTQADIPTGITDEIFGGNTTLPKSITGILQSQLALGQYRAWIPAGSSTTLTVLGSAAPTTTGTATTRNTATTNYFTMQKRLGFVSTATAGQTAGIRLAALQYGRGNITGGGFLFMARFGGSDAAAVAQARTFVGLVNTTGAIGNVNPSTLINCIGVGSDSGDANLSLIFNDAIGTASKITLGASFPANGLSTQVYQVVFYSPPGQTYVDFYCLREDTGTRTNTRISSDLPAVLLAPQFWRNNGTTALAVGIDVMGFSIQ
jgi:hypothetical protein